MHILLPYTGLTQCTRPAGVFEMESFSIGTNSLLECMSQLTKSGVITIIGGGDTASAALKLKKVKDLSFSHISTGGGASLELLEGKKNITSRFSFNID